MKFLNGNENKIDINLFTTQFVIRAFIFAGIVTNRRSRQIQKVLSELIVYAPICKKKAILRDRRDLSIY